MRAVHFVSNLGGSIGEISTTLGISLKKYFNLTREWEGQEAKEKDVLLCHFLNPSLSQSPEFNNFKKKILIQPIDGTDIYPEYVAEFNKYDLIICPGEASLKILISNGVSTKITVVPNWYEEDLFEKPITLPLEKHLPQDKIIFYHESTFHPRKGISMLYEGFIRAFSDTEYADKVLLVLKDTPHNALTFNDIEKLKRQAIKLQSYYKKPAQFIKFSTLLSKDELKVLWNRCNIYVSFAKIEGFGIPLLRHLLLKKTILCLDNINSGYNDYLNDNNAYLVPTMQVTASNEIMKLYTEKSKWAVASLEDIVKYFKLVLKDYLAGTNKTINNNFADLQRSIYEKYSYQKVLESYVNIINNI